MMVEARVENQAMLVVKNLQKKSYLLTPKALETLTNAKNPEELADIALENISKAGIEKFIIDESDFEIKTKTKIVPEEKLETKPVEVTVTRTSFKPLSKEYESRVKIIGNDVSEKSTSKGVVKDFVNYFRNRYENLSEILKTRGQENLVKIENAKSRRNNKMKLIGIVSDIRTTKNGHRFLILEDTKSFINALIPAGNPKLIEIGNRIVNDEIIAVKGRMSSRDLFIIESIYRPDIPMRDIKTTEEDLGIAMLSDIHIGSRLFLRENFERFLKWIKGEIGNQKQKELASKVKYITIAGDLVDGIGIYPGQENELEITDIFEQYRTFTEYIKEIPEYISVIVSPGNHDAVKNADPQPKLPEELVPELYEMENITFVGSPATVSLHNVNTLIYHGTSFSDFINYLPGSQFKDSAKMMVEMLKRRHLHPIYGGKPITPGKEDLLVIKEIPDIFHTGESHSNSYEIYKGTICINSGTWQQITEYQIKQGHVATPAILPVIETKHGKINVIHFDKPEM